MNALLKVSFLAALVLSGCGSPQTFDRPVAIEAPKVETKPEKEYFYAAGAIRYDVPKGEWVFIRDQYHEPMNVESIETFPDHVTVKFSFVASKVVTLMVTPDEQYAMRGITAGASIGLDDAVIYYGNKDGKLLTSQMGIGGSNLLFYGVFEK